MDELSTQTSASSCFLEKPPDPYNKRSCLSLLKGWVTWISQLWGPTLARLFTGPHLYC